MAAARFSTDALKMFYGRIPPRENRNLPQAMEPERILNYDMFWMSPSLFDEQLRVWKMTVSSRNPYNNDLFLFARENKAKITELIKTEIFRLKNVKVDFGFKVKFSIERNGETEYMEFYFREEDPHIFSRNSDQQDMKKEYDGYVEKMKEKIASWSENGSGWEVDTIMDVYVNVARYQELRGGSCFPLPQKLKNKKT